MFILHNSTYCKHRSLDRLFTTKEVVWRQVCLERCICLELGDIVVSETKIWSVITVVALSALLGLLGMEMGVFSDSDDDSSSVLVGLPST